MGLPGVNQQSLIEHLTHIMAETSHRLEACMDQFCEQQEMLIKTLKDDQLRYQQEVRSSLSLIMARDTTTEVSAQQVFDTSSERDFVFASPYTLTCHTTLSIGQLDYAIESAHPITTPCSTITSISQDKHKCNEEFQISEADVVIGDGSKLVEKVVDVRKELVVDAVEVETQLVDEIHVRNSTSLDEQVSGDALDITLQGTDKFIQTIDRILLKRERIKHLLLAMSPPSKIRQMITTHKADPTLIDKDPLVIQATEVEVAPLGENFEIRTTNPEESLLKEEVKASNLKDAVNGLAGILEDVFETGSSLKELAETGKKNMLSFDPGGGTIVSSMFTRGGYILEFLLKDYVMSSIQADSDAGNVHVLRLEFPVLKRFAPNTVAYFANSECVVVNAVREGSRLVAFKFTVARQDCPELDKATDDSFIEQKADALVWHLQETYTNFGSARAKERHHHIETVLANEPVEYVFVLSNTTIPGFMLYDGKELSHIKNIISCCKMNLIAPTQKMSSLLTYDIKPSVCFIVSSPHTSRSLEAIEIIGPGLLGRLIRHDVINGDAWYMIAIILVFDPGGSQTVS